MTQIVFSCISPHPPIILPSVGSEKDRKLVKETINSLQSLAKQLKEKNPDAILISSPHQDWGFNVPLYFLAKDFKKPIKTFLMGINNPKYYFEQGKQAFKKETANKIVLIASGDMSHCLKEDGPYGFKEDGPKFDRELIKCLKEKRIKDLLNLNSKFPEAGECGLRSFAFCLGMLEAAKADWQAKILSYQAPFGVGYLVANFKL